MENNDEINKLFDQLKKEMIEYCLDNLQEAIQYHIKYQKYNFRRKKNYTR